MALPIKPKDTQDGCNPISSNCVVWQGPDIPCIDLCNGDSVSDVVAKLAEELCTIVDQLDISLIDISCFGALAPEPDDFRDIIQLLIGRICSLEANSGNSGTISVGCPDDCLVTVADCLRPTDALGNLITELSIKDYLILIGNRICTIISQINGINGSITNIESRITIIEQTIAGIGGGTTIDITSDNCVGKGLTQPIQSFVLALELELCRLIDAVGTVAEINNAIAKQCTPNNRSLDEAAQLSNPGSSMANIPGWVNGSNYNTLSDAVNNLWLTICDMRTAISDIQATLATCCSVSCDDVNWNFTFTGVNGAKNLTLYFTGNIPTEFNYCGGATTNTNITILNSLGQLGAAYSGDVINAINTGSPLNIDLTTGPVSQYALWYKVIIPLCVTNGTYTCNTTVEYEYQDPNWCDNRNFTLITSSSIPSVSGSLTLTWTASGGATAYQIKLFDNTGSTPVQVGSTITVFATSGPQSYAFPGTYPSGDTYFVEVTCTQNGGAVTAPRSVECTSNVIAVA